MCVIRAGNEGPNGESFFSAERRFASSEIAPKKFFHTAGIFGAPYRGAEGGFSHPVLPWIVFFSDVDAIIDRMRRSFTRTSYRRAGL